MTTELVTSKGSNLRNDIWYIEMDDITTDREREAGLDRVYLGKCYGLARNIKLLSNSNITLKSLSEHSRENEIHAPLN